MKKILIILVLIYSSSGYADVAYELQGMVGWTIVETKMITAFREPGQEKRSGFEGCNGDTLIYFADGARAKCMSLGLQLSLMPTAVIFGKQTIYKGKKMNMYRMLVENEMYDIYF